LDRTSDTGPSPDVANCATTICGRTGCYDATRNWDGFYTGSGGDTHNSKWDETMRNIGKALISFLKNEDGPTAVEYAVMLALIVVVCITAITALGTNAANTFNYTSGQIKGSGS
jgi:pilus assembly protein Flp/PilA